MRALVAETLGSLISELNEKKIKKEQVVQVFTKPSIGNGNTEYVCIYVE